ncbi:helix-turn-helix transcriptional regulator [Streptomyces laurentii]|uniref:helix-turn-helix transcriptional regulator n=1 Tax=Streptomyces laurentii TaxID=39478 RepID=UPI003400411C
MRSSRLLSILLLLRTRDRMTAAELAAELEVSVRTVYRDVEALHAAGVPLYGDAGHRGGYRLLGGGGPGARLTDLYAPEAEALVLAGLPAAADGLGLGGSFADARRKLHAALPPPLREHVDRLRTRFHIDVDGWYADDHAVAAPYLPQVADAVRAGLVLAVRYRRWREPTDVDRRLAPYGLVLKAGRWYLIAGPDPRTYRVDQILGLSLTDEPVVIPPEFDLATYWRDAQRDFHDRLHRGEAVVRVSPRGAARLTGAAARAVTEHGTAEPDGWIRATLPMEGPDHAYGMLLALGTEVEVLGPEELRTRIAATVTALAARYASS